MDEFTLDLDCLMEKEIDIKGYIDYEYLTDERSMRDFIPIGEVFIEGIYIRVDKKTNSILVDQCEYDRNGVTIEAGHMYWQNKSNNIDLDRVKRDFKSGERIGGLGMCDEYTHNTDKNFSLKNSRGIEDLISIKKL